MSYVPIVIYAGLLQQQPVGESLTLRGHLDVAGRKIISSTGDLILQPAATKALRAESTGNARGEYAVDLQQARSLDTQAATGNHSVIGGGRANIAAGLYSTTTGGELGTLYNSYGTVVGGWSNYSSFHRAAIGGGYDNTVDAAGSAAIIGGGYTNSVANLCGTVGGGANNAVTGDYATISGGRVNDITANYSTVGGGYDNNVTAIYGAIGGGRENNDSNLYGIISGGYGNSVTVAAEQMGASIGGGASNLVTSNYGAISGGVGNSVSGSTATASGYYAKADKFGQQAAASGKIAALGDAQVSQFTLFNSTTDDTLTTLFLDGDSLVLVIPTDTTWAFEATIVARRTDTDNESARYKSIGCIDNNAGTTALVDAVQKVGADIEDSTDWAKTIDADASNNSLRIQVLGEDNKTIYWVACVRLVEVTG